MQLFHAAGARSFRVLWMLEELGLSYDLQLVAFPPRFRHDGYLALNPLGTVPLLLDGATRMTESAAILQYLSTRYGPSTLAVAPDEAAYGDYLNFLVMGEATLTFPQTIYLRYAMLEQEARRLPQAAADYARWFAVRLGAASGLMGPEYACAGRFTAADISMGYALLLASKIGLSEHFPPGISEYLERLQRREGFRRAEKAEGGAGIDLG